MKIVSSCLTGVKSRYDGSSNPDKKVIEMVEKGEAVPVCPEQLGGLPTPRPPQEIVGGTGKDVLDGKARVVNSEGRDVTREVLKGAEETLNIAKVLGAREAVFKSNSPACGCGKVYDGTFTGKLREGDGVTTALLKRNGIKVRTEGE